MSGRINTSAFSGQRSTPHDDVEVGDVSWLWPGRIPFGQITLFAGKTDVGKTLVVDDVVARVTVGAE
ncbi:MAG TPA: AAA family ATPase [Xanthobacteraceae bacterium]